jgi:hypothetical protein
MHRVRIGTLKTKKNSWLGCGKIPSKEILTSHRLNISTFYASKKVAAQFVDGTKKE